MKNQITLDPRSPVGILHAGRLGASLAVALSEVGYPVRLVHRRDSSDAEAVAARIDEARATSDPQAVVDDCDVVFVTCVDQRIGEVVGALRFRPGQAVVHCSGATPLSVMDSASAEGALTGGFHPLQLFPDEHGQARFAGITVGIEAADEGLRAWLVEVAESLGGRAISIAASERALYHASGVMVSPLFAGLVGLAADLWTGIGRSREEALEALAPLFLATARQIEAKGISAAIAGPFARGDVVTVEHHVEALRAADPEALRVYATLALAQLPLSAERGNISRSERRRLEELLGPVARS